MTKCMFQECDCEATKTIPCIMDSENTKNDIHVCDFHHKLLTEKSACKSFSFEIIGKDNYD